MTGSEGTERVNGLAGDGAAGVVARARDLLPLLAHRATEVDTGTRSVAEGLRLLGGTGALDWLRPSRFGGVEGNPVDFFALVREVSAACASTGWLLGLLGVNAFHVALFEEQAQQDVAAAGGRPLVCSAHAPVGRIRRAPDGWLLSGHWQHAPGAELADWAVLAAVEEVDGRPVDHVHVLVPRTLLLTESHDPGLGLRGGLDSALRATDVLVPAHRVLRSFEVARLRAPGRTTNPGPVYAMPWGVLQGYAVTAPVIGAAQGSYDHVVRQAREGTRLSLGGARLAQSSSGRARLGRAAVEIDAAVLLTERSLRDLHTLARAGDDLPAHLRLRARRDQVSATERCIAAVDLLFAGRTGLTLAHAGPVERAWRDVHAAVMHLSNDADTALADFGASELGLRIEDDLH